MNSYERTAGGKIALFLLTFVIAILFAAHVILTVFYFAVSAYDYANAEADIESELTETCRYQTIESYIHGTMLYSDFAPSGFVVSDRRSNLRFALYDADGNLAASTETYRENDADADNVLYAHLYEESWKDEEGTASTRYIVLSRMEDGAYEVGTESDETVSTKLLSSYTVYSYVDRDLPVLDNYAVSVKAIRAFYSYRFAVYPVMLVLLILGMFFFMHLMAVSGRRCGSEELFPGPLYKVPGELILAVIAVAGFLTVAPIAEYVYVNTEYSIMIMLVMLALIFLLIFLWFSMGCAARVKGHTLLKNTIIYKCIHGVFRMFRWTLRGIKKFFEYLPLTWRTVLLYAGVMTAFLIFLVILLNTSGYIDGDVTLVIFILGFGLHLFLMVRDIRKTAALKKLTDKSGEMAEGHYGNALDPGTLPTDFRKHAVQLNTVQQGVQLAVEEQMKSERMKTELITNVSHDIKTPLTSIINYADLISKEPTDNEKIREYAEVLSRQSDRLKRLIEDLVEASKASTGNLEVKMAPCDAGIIVSQIAGEYEDKFTSLGLTQELKVPDAEVRIMADGRRMLRVFDNIMGNICKYAQTGTRVYISLEQIGARAVFIFKNVSKNRLNISPEELMERFVRGDKSRNTDGNGLGLSIAKSLTELQGGRLQISIDGDLFKVQLSFPVISD